MDDNVAFVNSFFWRKVAVLSDQIENQTEKITDLERILDDKKEVLKKTEELLQREMLNR
jgi:hypothetical protein